MTCDKWHMTCYTWHVTHDTWHVTIDTLHVTCLGWWTFFQNFRSLAFTVCDFWYYEDLEEKAHSANEGINHEAVYKKKVFVNCYNFVCFFMTCCYFHDLSWMSWFVMIYHESSQIVLNCHGFSINALNHHAASLLWWIILNC